MAMSGPKSPLMTMNMEKIWMPLPIIHIMKHMNPTCLNGAVAVCHKACRQNAQWTRQEAVK
jgi:hypothetical protein